MSSSEPRITLSDGFPPIAGLPVPPPSTPSGWTLATSPHAPAPPPVPTAPPGQAPAAPATSAQTRTRFAPLASMANAITDAPPWLFSAAVHMVAMIVLGLLFIQSETRRELTLRFDYADRLGEEVGLEDLNLAVDQFETPIEPETAVPGALPQVDEIPIELPTIADQPLLDSELDQTRAPIRMSLSGREAGMREALLEAYGGTAATQQAVMEGLRWLARYQDRGGMWRLDGKYAGGVNSNNPEAATALALLAFQGAGYTTKSDAKDPFTSVVTRAWMSLLARQDENGNFFHTGRAHGQLYTQALCTIALCELYGMTQDSYLREPAQRAVDYCVSIQSAEGGWRYFPGTGSDLSVTGWFVMALQSARMAGLEVPTLTLSNVGGFLDTVERDMESRYAYQESDPATNSMTAEGLLCRQYLGWRRDDRRLQDGADFLVRHLPSWDDNQRNAYYWYYATQVCHHMEGEHWRTWNNAMRQVLPAQQVRDGKERGSWNPKGDRWGNSGGRLFVTCLHIYMLEVYYRHLPIYQMHMLAN